MTIKSKNYSLQKLLIASMFLALALILPFFTGQIKQIGNALCPMHIPVLLCGYFCGPLYGLFVGFVAPLLRFIIFGLPPIYPVGISMCFELAAYGFTVGLLYIKFPKKTFFTYASLIVAMITGRAIWGISKVIIYEVGNIEFGWQAFIASAFVNSIPGIIVQIIIIPFIVSLFNKNKIRNGIEG